MEVLQNIKFVMDHDLILRDDFYNEGHLKQFSGAEEVRLREPELVVGKSSAGCRLSGFSRLSPLILLNGISMDSLSIGLRRAFDGHNLIWTSLDFTCREGGPSVPFESFVDIFGFPTSIPSHPYRMYPPHNPEHPIIIPKATHRYGNAEGVYISRDSHFVRYIHIDLGSNGDVRKAHWSITPKEHEDEQFHGRLRELELLSERRGPLDDAGRGVPLASAIGHEVECLLIDGSRHRFLIRGLGPLEFEKDYQVAVAKPDGSDPHMIAWSSICEVRFEGDRMKWTYRRGTST